MREKVSVEWKPNKWIAAALGFFGQPFGLLYVMNVKWAAIYFALGLVIGVSEFLLLSRGVAPWLSYFSFSVVLMVACSVHAYRIAAYGPAHTKRPWYSRWYGLCAIFLAPISAIFLARAFLYEPFRFPSASMFPTAQPGSYLIARKWGYGNYGTYGISVLRRPISAEIKRGDIVVFDFPGNPDVQFAKRVIGIPGDALEFSGRQLKINEVLVESNAEPARQVLVGNDPFQYTPMRETLSGIAYTVAYSKPAEERVFSVVVPGDSFFVLGDNRDRSNDSRYWGFVPAENIVGKVVYIGQ